jgi:hypothetical protein
MAFKVGCNLDSSWFAHWLVRFTNYIQANTLLEVSKTCSRENGGTHLRDLPVLLEVLWDNLGAHLLMQLS